MSGELKVDDRVQILVGGPHENYGRIATVGYIQENGQVVVYFGDQDEDEWVYAPSELEKRPAPDLCPGSRVRVSNRLTGPGRHECLDCKQFVPMRDGVLSRHDRDVPNPAGGSRHA